MPKTKELNVLKINKLWVNLSTVVLELLLDAFYGR